VSIKAGEVHLEMPTGQLVLTGAGAQRASTAPYEFTWGQKHARGELAATPALQRERRMLNATVSLIPATAREALDHSADVLRNAISSLSG
jgi:hypothetical protein